jgi:hypothetical protein
MPMRTLDLVAALRPVRGKCANGARFSPKGWRNVGPHHRNEGETFKESGRPGVLNSSPNRRTMGARSAPTSAIQTAIK